MPREPPVMTAALPANEIMTPPKSPKKLNRDNMRIEKREC
jgi:hypothetical protein